MLSDLTVDFARCDSLKVPEITSTRGLLNWKVNVFLVAFENEQTSETLQEILCRSPRVFLQLRVIL